VFPSENMTRIFKIENDFVSKESEQQD